MRVAGGSSRPAAKTTKAPITIGDPDAMTTAADLLNTPSDGPSWDRWAFILDRNVAECQAAISAQLNVALPTIQIYPVPFVDLGNWLGRVSDAIGQIADTLKLINADVENVDLEDERARQAWTYQIYSEIRDARAVLKI
jgi:hypothetical protein